MRIYDRIIATPEEFLYMKSVFVIKDSNAYSSGDWEWFSGSIFGVNVITDTFKKGKYTL